ncbi:PREDICTED: myelin-oligodendrocyte glycoprotein-like isoform X2 [Poecilia mexicana]|uniref:myelin-oligodendrocyte glycoprotein-like isoform X2 n=1 Tax=Poecilia mexicana TaxID=48701 RepID=UPI00072E9540|nr:PREDICTED: myelin-oligodendrocyte glycoprotein-like isoform X2 [Poecilia mexicana]
MIFLHLFAYFLLILQVSAADVAVTPGGAADLQCQTPGAAAATVVEWTKDGLPASEYVFFYRNGRPYEKYQHDSFRGRVALKNRSGPGSGDVSVVLKNVSVEDEGTYRCRVRMSSSGTEAEEHLQVSRLRVALRSGSEAGNGTGNEAGNEAGNGTGNEAGNEAGNVQRVFTDGAAGPNVAVLVGVLMVCVCVAGVGFYLFRRNKSSHQRTEVV